MLFVAIQIKPNAIFENMLEREAGQFRMTLTLTVMFTAVLWIVWLMEYLFPELHITSYGIIPRSVIGLRGIILSPFIHDDRSVTHIMSNTLPFMMLFFVLLNAYRQIAIVVLVLIHLLTGVMVWILAPPETIHIGISGVIYGMAAFLVGSGLFRRDITSITVSILVVFLYGGSMAAGLVPQQGISWQSHLCGAAVGIFIAFTMRNYNRAPESLPNEEPEDERHFFERYP